MQRYCLFSWYTTILRGISCRWWIFFEKKDGFVLPYQKKVVILQYQNALWCNGSTPDSGSVCEGSSPSKATKSKSSLWWFALFLFVPARNRGHPGIHKRLTHKSQPLTQATVQYPRLLRFSAKLNNFFRIPFVFNNYLWGFFIKISLRIIFALFSVKNRS